MEIPSKIQHLIDQGFTFRLGDYFTKGWALIIRNPWPFVGFTAIHFAIQVGLSLVPVVGVFGLLLVVPPLNAGYYMACNEQAQQRQVNLQSFFKAFDFIGPLGTQYGLMNVIYMILLAPMMISMFSGVDLMNPDTWEGIELQPLTMIWLLPALYLAIAWRWAPLFVVFFNLNFWVAMEASRRLISRQWWIYFLFVLATGLFYMSGTIVFFIGLLFTFPVMKAMDYAAFSDVVRLLEDPRVPEVEDSFMD